MFWESLGQHWLTTQTKVIPSVGISSLRAYSSWGRNIISPNVNLSFNWYMCTYTQIYSLYVILGKYILMWFLRTFHTNLLLFYYHPSCFWISLPLPSLINAIPVLYISTSRRLSPFPFLLPYTHNQSMDPFYFLGFWCYSRICIHIWRFGARLLKW